jgi:hypothetical protein
MANRSKEGAAPLIFSLAYCSRATQNLGRAEIETLVAEARVRNSREKITGWLVCGSGIFFQWLEGSRENVKRLMSSIMADARHNTIVVLSESEDVRERLFGDWDMELVSVRDIREVLVEAIAESKDTKSLNALHTLMKEIDSRDVKPGLINNLIDF